MEVSFICTVLNPVRRHPKALCTRKPTEPPEQARCNNSGQENLPCWKKPIAGPDSRGRSSALTGLGEKEPARYFNPPTWGWRRCPQAQGGMLGFQLTSNSCLVALSCSKSSRPINNLSNNENNPSFSSPACVAIENVWKLFTPLPLVVSGYTESHFFALPSDPAMLFSNGASLLAGSLNSESSQVALNRGLNVLLSHADIWLFSHLDWHGCKVWLTLLLLRLLSQECRGFGVSSARSPSAVCLQEQSQMKCFIITFPLFPPSGYEKKPTIKVCRVSRFEN